MKVKNLLILFLSFLPLLASADPVEIDGIYYNLLENNKAEVTSRPSGNYSGTINIPESFTYENVDYDVTSIGANAFIYCSGLTSVTIPNSVTSIGLQAFIYCYGLKTVNIPNSVTTFGNYAFSDCTSLTTVTIPNSVSNFGTGVFSGCTRLTTVNIVNGPKSMGIGMYAFSGCTGLTSIDIPNCVTSIARNAFTNCSNLATVSIGTGIKNIYTESFAKCPKLKDFYCFAENVPTTMGDAFNDSNVGNATLHVRSASLSKYQAKTPWSSFGTIISTKCEMPTISYADHKLSFECETEDVEFVYEITDEDIKSGTANEVELTVTYNVSVYAKKALFDNSEAATATLCWVDQEPVIHTDISEAVEFTAAPVLIQSYGGIVTVQGAADGTPVSIYTTAGTQAGSAVSQHSMARINTNMQPGTIAIIKIGDKSVKTVVK